MAVLVPPFRFATVEEGVYRGAYPTLKNFRFMRRWALRTIISIIPETPTADLREFCEFEGIALHHFRADKFVESVTLEASLVARIIEFIINPNNQPIYIHCLDGSNVTGLVIMCLRKLQNWNFVSICSEFIRYARGQEISSDESRFVESFSNPIQIPDNISQWLWRGLQVSQHPSIPLIIPKRGDAKIPNTRQSQDKKSEVQRPEAQKQTKNRDTANTRTLQALALEGLDLKLSRRPDEAKPEKMGVIARVQISQSSSTPQELTQKL